jgi:hypothetical protein
VLRVIATDVEVSGLPLAIGLGENVWRFAPTLGDRIAEEEQLDMPCFARATFSAWRCANRSARWPLFQ